MRVLILDLDTLRPDHLGCYGYHRNTSPNIDSVAREGVRFNNYYCSDAPCLPSRSALMSGMFGIHNGAVGHGGTAADQKLQGESRQFKSDYAKNSLPFLFRKAGFHTVSISPFAERHSSFWFYAGFNEMYNTGISGNEPAHEIAPVALDWLDRKGKEDNWLLHVNFWDPHTPYRTPESFGNPFENEPIEDWMTQEIIDKHRQDCGPHGVREISMFSNETKPKHPRQPGEVRDMEEYKKLIDGYDCGILYMDQHIGMLFDKIKELGVWDDLAIIITSDHGENMGELNSYAEHSTADYITCRIPMIIKWNGCVKGHVDDCLHYNVDLAPTVAEILNVAPWDKWDGKSYAKTLFNGENCEREYIVLSQCAHVCQRSVRFGDYIYIRTYHDGFHNYDKEMLFNIKEDPHELNDISKTHRELCYKAAYLLMEWHDEMMATIDDGIDPLRTVILEGGPYHARGNLFNYTEYLRKTGRENHALRLEKQYGEIDSKYSGTKY
ncbi:MAG: Choline-sulfatase [Firmicutes bacterium ADurb.Bin193]|nr:MAG: Choline-sulfatase [Firmicutes bacterium ADurb.Bin193]